MSDWLKDFLIFLGTVQRLISLPDKIERLIEKVEKRPIVSAAEGVCSDCIKLTQAVSTETVEYVLGTLRELLIEARDVLMAGENKQLGISMLNRVIEIASTQLTPVKERKKEEIIQPIIKPPASEPSEVSIPADEIVQPPAVEPKKFCLEHPDREACLDSDYCRECVIEGTQRAVAKKKNGNGNAQAPKKEIIRRRYDWQERAEAAGFDSIKSMFRELKDNQGKSFREIAEIIDLKEQVVLTKYYGLGLRLS